MVIKYFFTAEKNQETATLISSNTPVIDIYHKIFCFYLQIAATQIQQLNFFTFVTPFAPQASLYGDFLSSTIETSVLL